MTPLHAATSLSADAVPIVTGPGRNRVATGLPVAIAVELVRPPTIAIDATAATMTAATINLASTSVMSDLGQRVRATRVVKVQTIG